MTRRKICVVTTSRADFGLLHELMLQIESDKRLKLQLIVTGMHLSKRSGLTVHELETAGLKIDRRVDLRLNGDTAVDNASAIGRGVSPFAQAFAELKPAIIVLLGDRFELFAPATAALLQRIPIAHIHGGERTEGALDDSIRHAITKLATFHFPATESYRRRIIQMGEQPDRVFNFGAPGLDEVHRCNLLTREELRESLQITMDDPIALVTYHPETNDATKAGDQIRTVLTGIVAAPINAVFTMANADTGGASINSHIRSLCEKYPDRFKWAANLGRRRYLSCMMHLSLMIGNSSSGLTEAPSFKLPVVNIGDRQRGRERARNVLDVPRNADAITRGIERAISHEFRNSLKGMRNPYDRFHDGRTSERIKNVLRDVELNADCLKKEFYDLKIGRNT